MRFKYVRPLLLFSVDDLDFRVLFFCSTPPLPILLTLVTITQTADSANRNCTQSKFVRLRRWFEWWCTGRRSGICLYLGVYACVLRVFAVPLLHHSKTFSSAYVILSFFFVFVSMVKFVAEHEFVYDSVFIALVYNILRNQCNMSSQSVSFMFLETNSSQTVNMASASDRFPFHGLK